MSEPRRCFYCFGPIPVGLRRRRYCCPEHARRGASIEAVAASGRDRAVKKIMRGQQELFSKKKSWRDVAMGRDPDAALGRIFGGRKRRKSPEL